MTAAGELKNYLATSTGFEQLSAEAAAAMAALMTTCVVKKGDTLFSKADREHGLYRVLDGELRAVESAPFSGVVRTITSGEAVDELQILAGIENAVVIEVMRDSKVGWIDGSELDALADRFPEVRQAIERLHRLQLLSRLHSVFGTFDREFLGIVAAMADWVHLERGELLFEQSNQRDGI